MEKEGVSRYGNATTYVSISAVIIGIILAISYLRMNKNSNYDKTSILQSDTIKLLKENILVKDSIIKQLSIKLQNSEKKLSLLKPNQPHTSPKNITKLFDSAFIEISYITSKYIFKKNKLDTMSIILVYDFHKFLSSLEGYPTVFKCLTSSINSSSHTIEVDLDKKNQSANQFISGIISYLKKEDRYNDEKELEILRKNSLNILNKTKREIEKY